MHPLLIVVLAPVSVLVLSLLIPSTRLLSRIAPVLFFVQLAAMAFSLFPVLAGQEKVFCLLPELCVDRLGALFSLLTQVVVAAATTHAVVFFEQDDAHNLQNTRSVRIFYACSSLLLLAMTAVYFCDNLGFIWIALETTTLCSASLVYYHGTKHSLEAAWKYLIICSVGIAFALFGTVLIFASSQYGATPKGSLNLSELSAHAEYLRYPLLRLGFLFCLLGYGTKAGIFPLHGWVPDAYSAAPAPASAMLSGGLLNCSLFAIWRLCELVRASGHDSFVQHGTLTIGVTTVIAASIFLVHQHGIKRLFAYSSIENVGLMIIAIGLGSGHLFFLLAFNLSVAKVALFLTVGNIVQSTGTKAIADIHGLLAKNPQWALVLLAGSLAVSGAPPFGVFLAEWGLLVHITQFHHWLVVAGLVIGLTISFLAVMFHVGKIVCGTCRPGDISFYPWRSVLVPAGLMVVSLIAGVSGLSQLF